MPATFELEIATPERMLLREQVSEAQIPTSKGYIGVLPEHAPLLAELGDGRLTYTAAGRKRSIAVHTGWVEVLPDRTRVLSNIAERAEEIDIERARHARERAEQRLINPAIGIDIARALSALARAESRLETAQEAER
jgi:F-type H+-transporting ATPase subunit epsilon